MKKSGNGRPETCAYNLLRTIRGEVPFDRIRGIDGTLIDKPKGYARARADTEWLIRTYEPRISIKEIDLQGTDLLNGELMQTVDVERKEDS